MEKGVESVRRNFGTVRTGRANVSILDRIQARPALAPHTPTHPARSPAPARPRARWSTTAR
jgi:hypothetical protein